MNNLPPVGEVPQKLTYSGNRSGLAEYLSDQPAGGPARICILTQDIFGPVRNAGIGTAYMHAADFWAQAGHSVTILFTQGRVSQNRTIEYWIDYYKEKGVTFLCAEEIPSVQTATPALRWSYQGYRALTKLPAFDFVHSSECGASPYFSLMAKKNSGEFASSIFCIKTSSPHLWSRQGNEAAINLDTGLVICAAERYCVENADLVISPSQHMLNWMSAHGYQLPKDVCVHPNVMPLSAMRTADNSDKSVKEIKEIVFFGRLEPRKGLLLFADALKLMRKTDSTDFNVVFLGKKVDDFDFDAFVADLKRDLPVEIRAIHNFNATQAVSYLTGPRRLAVIPSLLDNSPFTVYESLTNGILFVAADVGGVAELIHPDDRKRTLFAPNPKALARTLARILNSGTQPGRLSFDPHRSLSVWDEFHRRPKRDLLKQPASIPPSPAGAPKWVDIAVPHDMSYPLNIEETIAQLETDSNSWAVLRLDTCTFEPKEMEHLVNLAAAHGEALVVPATRIYGSGAVLVNFEPSVWTKPEFSRLECPAIACSSRLLASLLRSMLSFKSMYATNIDSIVAVACREGTSIQVLPAPMGVYSGQAERRLTRTQRSRQFEYLAAGLPADVGNILRLYGALADERSRVLTAQPILKNTMRLLRLLQKLEGTKMATPQRHTEEEPPIPPWPQRLFVWVQSLYTGVRNSALSG